MENKLSTRMTEINSLVGFPNFIANVSGFGSSSAKSAGVFQTKALSLEQCGCNTMLGSTKIEYTIEEINKIAIDKGLSQESATEQTSLIMLFLRTCLHEAP